MDARKRLFRERAIYDYAKTEALFVQAMRENVLYHQKHSIFYARLLKNEGFNPLQIHSLDDCARIPVIPAAFFKYHEVLSTERQNIAIHATSSGTQGQKSQMFYDEPSLRLGTRMAISCFAYHGLISPLPTNYIMLGYEPIPGNEMGAIKTAMGVTRFAPAVSRTFVLRHTPDGYEVDYFGVLAALQRYARQKLPVRFVGFPSYLYYLLKALQQQKCSFRFGRHSYVLLGGGWKQHAGDTIDQKELFDLAEQILGIPRQNCRDFYSAVEHPLAYAQCKHHHLHVPIFSRVIIRDVKTLAPLGFDEPGFLSFITPLLTSAPLCSVMMGDLAVLRDGKDCSCGVETPYFEVLGRAGVSPMRNCAISATELLRSSP